MVRLNLQKFDSSHINLVKLQLEHELSQVYNDNNVHRVQWEIIDCFYVSTTNHVNISTFAYITMERSWDYLEDAPYLIVILTNAAGGKINFFFNVSEVFVNEKNHIVICGNLNKIEPYFFSIYFIEALLTICCDPEMRLSLLV